MSSLVPLLRTCAVRTIPRRLLHISTPLYRDVYGFGQSATEPEVSAVRESRNATRRKLKEERQRQIASEIFQREIVALSARLGEHLPADLVEEAVTDYSAEMEVSNDRLSAIGEETVRNYTSQHIKRLYPKLPNVCVSDIMEHLSGPFRIGLCAKAFGIDAVVRIGEEGEQSEAVTKSFMAIVGAIQEQHGVERAEKFVHDSVIAQLKTMDVASAVQFDRPHDAIASVLRSEGMEQPKYRIVAEAGRLTHKPTFVVGLFSGEKELAKGVGWSIKEAKKDAAKAALIAKLATPEPVAAAN